MEVNKCCPTLVVSESLFLFRIGLPRGEWQITRHLVSVSVGGGRFSYLRQPEVKWSINRRVGFGDIYGMTGLRCVGSCMNGISLIVVYVL